MDYFVLFLESHELISYVILYTSTASEQIWRAKQGRSVTILALLMLKMERNKKIDAYKRY